MIKGVWSILRLSIWFLFLFCPLHFIYYFVQLNKPVLTYIIYAYKTVCLFVLSSKAAFLKSNIFYSVFSLLFF